MKFDYSTNTITDLVYKGQVCGLTKVLLMGVCLTDFLPVFPTATPTGSSSLETNGFAYVRLKSLFDWAVKAAESHGRAESLDPLSMLQLH